MLDGSAIQPSQSPWCNAVVLVRKKDGLPLFCIDFCHLNARTKDTYPLPCMQETMESMVGTWHFSCMDLKSGLWQVIMAEESREYTIFTVGSMGVYEFLCMSYGLCNAELSRGAEPYVCLNLFGKHNHLLQNGRGTPCLPVGCPRQVHATFCDHILVFELISSRDPLTYSSMQSHLNNSNFSWVPATTVGPTNFI